MLSSNKNTDLSGITYLAEHTTLAGISFSVTFTLAGSTLIFSGSSANRHMYMVGVLLNSLL